MPASVGPTTYSLPIRTTSGTPTRSPRNSLRSARSSGLAASGRRNWSTPICAWWTLGGGRPILRCSRASRLRHGEGRPLRTLLGRSFVLGCACLMNRPLLELALPMPADVASHDWWVALCAAAAGWIAYRSEPMLDYRRHGGNASGSAGFWAGWNPLRHPWRKRWESGTAAFRRSVAQAESLRQRLGDRRAPVAAEDAGVLAEFCGLFRRPGPRWQRVVRLCRLGIPAIDLPRRLLYYLCVLMLPGETTPVGPAVPLP